jgi:hypothetical protein
VFVDGLRRSGGRQVQKVGSDLPARLAAGGPYNTHDPATFYGGDARGYTDYPTLTDPAIHTA